jgi:carbonic anhydrase
MSAIEIFLDGNAKFAADFSAKGLSVPPAKRAAIVACMDARLDTGALLGLQEGDAHVIRNAGGVVTDDVIRSLTISQRLLGTNEIMLIHHTDCGMLTFTDAELKDAIQEDAGVRPPFEFAAFEDLETDVRESIERIRACPFLLHTDAIRGFVYQVDTGQLQEVE